MGKNKNRRQKFPPITVAALAAARGEKASGGDTEPKHHLVQVLAEPKPLTTDTFAEEVAWTKFVASQGAEGRSRAARAAGKRLRRGSFIAGYRAAKGL